MTRLAPQPAACQGSWGARAQLVCCMLLVSWAAAAMAQRATAATPASEWAVYQAQAASVSYGDSSTGDALGSVMRAHSFRTPLQRILASDVYSGSNARLRRVVNDLMTGKAVKVVAIGGVATNGTDASRPGTNDYVAQYVRCVCSVECEKGGRDVSEWGKEQSTWWRMLAGRVRACVCRVVQLGCGGRVMASVRDAGCMHGGCSTAACT